MQEYLVLGTWLTIIVTLIGIMCCMLLGAFIHLKLQVRTVRIHGNIWIEDELMIKHDEIMEKQDWNYV